MVRPHCKNEVRFSAYVRRKKKEQPGKSGAQLVLAWYTQRPLADPQLRKPGSIAPNL